MGPPVAVVRDATQLEPFLRSNSSGWLGHPTAWMLVSSSGDYSEVTKSIYSAVSSTLEGVKKRMTNQVHVNRQSTSPTGQQSTLAEPLLDLCQPCMISSQHSHARLE